MSINKRKLWIGVISSLFVILLRFLFGLDDYEVAIAKTIDPAKQLIFIIALYYLYFSILFLLKDVLIDFYNQEFLRTNLIWTIKLNALIAALSIMTVLGFGKYLAAILVIVAIIALIFYIRVYSDIMLVDVQVVPSVKQLHMFFKAILIAMLLAFIFTVVVKHVKRPELAFINEIFIAIPFMFIATFFFKTMKEIYK